METNKNFTENEQILFIGSAIILAGLLSHYTTNRTSSLNIYVVRTLVEELLEEIKKVSQKHQNKEGG